MTILTQGIPGRNATNAGNSVPLSLAKTGSLKDIGAPAAEAGGLSPGETRGRGNEPKSTAMAAFGPPGTIFVADRWNKCIRKIVAESGEVSTFSAGYLMPNAVAVDRAGSRLVISDAQEGTWCELRRGCMA